MGAKPLEGAKNWFWLKKLLCPATNVRSAEVQVTDQALKAFLPPSNSLTCKIPAPLNLIPKSFYSVIITFFLGFFFYTRHCMIDRTGIGILLLENLVNLCL